MEADHEQERSRIKIDHAALNVSDLDVSEAFYQEALGLRVARESLHPCRCASMAREGKVVLTLWEQRRGRFKMHRPGLHHLAFEARSVEEVNRAKGILANLGARWSERTALYHEGAISAGIYFSDPDGMRIELYVRENARKRSPKEDLRPSTSDLENQRVSPALSFPQAPRVLH
jgi:lactoylglutathione lyase